MGEVAQARTYTFELPKGYTDEKGVLHKEVTLREMTGSDQEAMLNPQLKNNPARMLSSLFARVIVKLGSIEGGRVDTAVTAAMLKSDRDFLMLKLKEIDSGPEVEVQVECPDCERKFKAAVDVGDFFSKQG